MATLYWQGGAVAVAQQSTGSIDSVDGTPANNTFHVTLGDIAVSAVGDTDVATTAAALVASLNASTHPYFAAVTWTNPSAGNIVGVGDTAGVPFLAVLTETGAGTGAVTDFADDTAATGPNHWDEAQNWSTGAVPVSSDDVIVKNSDVPIAWGLAQAAVDLTSLSIEKSFTGTIGLRPDQFATSADSATLDSTVPEYRQVYLDIGADDIDIGQHLGPGSPAGSSRLFLDNDKAGASELRVHGTASGGEGSNPALAYLAAHASANVEVRDAPGGLGIGTLAPAETATVGTVTVSAVSPTTRVYVGEGVTLTNYAQAGGQNMLSAAATITAVTVDGGELDIEGGDYVVTTLTVNEGTVNDRHDNAGGTAVTTLALNGGEVDMTGGGFARTVATLTFKGGVLSVDDDDVTVSSAFIGSAGGRKRVEVTSA